ncbi:hypothetical protein HDU81_009678 [Chytriomyces hyalinus]|nr:hypothetical protein HDU81_009678 [Chytriomyces hyalinus]
MMLTVGPQFIRRDDTTDGTWFLTSPTGMPGFFIVTSEFHRPSHKLIMDLSMEMAELRSKSEKPDFEIYNLQIKHDSDADHVYEMMRYFFPENPNPPHSFFFATDGFVGCVASEHQVTYNNLDTIYKGNPDSFHGLDEDPQPSMQQRPVDEPIIARMVGGDANTNTNTKPTPTPEKQNHQANFIALGAATLFTGALFFSIL